MTAALGELFGLAAAGPYKETRASNRPAPDTVTASKERIHVRRLQLSREETSALVRGARAANTSVQGALLAALAVAGRHYREAWRTEAIRYAIAMDMRTLLSMVGDTPWLLVSAHLGTIEPSVRSFWGLARAVSDDLAKSRTREAVRAGMLRLRQLVDVEHEPAGFSVLQRDLAGFQHDLFVTNYGNLQLRSQFGRLKLNALSTGSPSGNIDTQKISVIPLDGRVMMTQVSPAPFPSLLEDARSILTLTCAA
jgi:hypothetical protein